MERIHTLIDKLCQQKKENASPSHLLFTVQMLHAELLQLDQVNAAMGTTRVAVSLPVNLNFVDEVVRTALRQSEEEVEPVEATDPLPGPEVAAAEKQAYVLKKPEVPAPVKKVVEEKPQPSQHEPAPGFPQQEAVQTQPVLNHAFGYEAEAPTITQYTQPHHSAYTAQPEKEVYELQPARELHEMFGQPDNSLNDRLKEHKTELAHKLTGAPIKDLRKAIGINDRFTFINELFRGDEAMYERSLKTINGFGIYSEAEYWIQRELTLKLGWQEKNPVVQEFIQLVRRRFA